MRRRGTVRETREDLRGDVGGNVKELSRVCPCEIIGNCSKGCFIVAG